MFGVEGGWNFRYCSQGNFSVKEETLVSRSSIWWESILGRRNSEETSVAKCEWGREEKWKMWSERKGGRQAMQSLQVLYGWAFYMERPLRSDQDLECCVEESGLFLHPGKSHWSTMNKYNLLWIRGENSNGQISQVRIDQKGGRDRLEARRPV